MIKYPYNFEWLIYDDDDDHTINIRTLTRLYPIVSYPSSNQISKITTTTAHTLDTKQNKIKTWQWWWWLMVELLVFLCVCWSWNFFFLPAWYLLFWISFWWWWWWTREGSMHALYNTIWAIFSSSSSLSWLFVLNRFSGHFFVSNEFFPLKQCVLFFSFFGMREFWLFFFSSRFVSFVMIVKRRNEIFFFPIQSSNERTKTHFRSVDNNDDSYRSIEPRKKT